ncbi:MAG: hypothetical protein PVH61_05195 [Candidatus Aminicenantes bacterium]|jgi:hypothetical protein
MARILAVDDEPDNGTLNRLETFDRSCEEILESRELLRKNRKERNLANFLLIFL